MTGTAQSDEVVMNRDKEIKLPEYISRTGKLIYSEPDNPYETIEVYLEETPQFIVKSYISEHAPDGGSSYRLLVMDEESGRTLKIYAGGDLTKFLKKFWTQRRGMTDLEDFLSRHGMIYRTGHYM